MNLPIPVPSQTGGPQYAQDEVSCFNQIDGHNHTPGQGALVPLNGLNVNQNFNMNSLSVTNLKSIQLLNQAVSPGSSSLYMLGNNLYWADGTGSYNVQITSGNAVAVSGAIGFSGLPSGTASAAYVSGTGTFRFQSATNTGATLDIGPLKTRNTTASSNAVTITPPNPLAADYTLTLPNALPASTKIMRLDSSGNVSANLDIDNSTLAIVSNTLKVNDLGIGTNQLANSSVTSAKLDLTGLSISAANRTPTTATQYTFNTQTPTYPARWTVVGGSGALNNQLVTSFAYTPSRTNVNLLCSLSQYGYGGSYLYWASWNGGGPGPSGPYYSNCYLRIYFQNPNITKELLSCTGGTNTQNTRIIPITDTAAGNVYIYFYWYNDPGAGYVAMFTGNLIFNFVELN